MIHYQDRTFCITPGCTKPHALTPAIEKAAQNAGLPVACADLCSELADLARAMAAHLDGVNRALDPYEIEWVRAVDRATK